ncbi:MAG: GGDEF domain-containing protein [Tenericutes bacterium]|nr:GGDEF domain-containing protein [Mycoplasmatota bacterium]
MPSFDLNFFAIMILVSLLAIIYLIKDTVNIKSRLFRMMIFTTILMNVIEILSWVFEGQTGEFNWYMNFTFNFLFTALGPVVVGLWACYIDYHTFKDYERLLKKWYYFLPAVIMVLLSFVNIFYPILFTISGTNEYTRLPLIWISIPMTVVVYIYLLILVMKAKKADNKKVVIGVLLFLSFPIVAAVFQMLFFGKTYIWPSTAIAILISYLIFETTSNSKDYLTGIFNRERADETIDRYLLKAKKFSVIMLDINNFKKINDTKGHHFGDQVLVEIASIISSVFHGNATVCRYGGDEFIIVSETYDNKVLLQKKAEIFEAVKNTKLTEISDIKLSCGICICDSTKDCTIDQVIIMADIDMYRDKELTKKEK